MTQQIILGMMSGTSLDGIDAVLVEFQSSKKLKLLATKFTPYPDVLKSKIAELSQSNKLINQSLNDSFYRALEHDLNQLYAHAALNLIHQRKATHATEPFNVVAIANHGQTIIHSPNTTPPYSLQLGDGQTIANLTGINTLCQFRQADMAVGGQGAPLMPAFHNAVFNAAGKVTAIINVGGIANVTVFKNEKVIGYDTGPANTLLDQWINKHQQKKYDDNGNWASQGTVQTELLNVLLQDPYFNKSYPKSTGTEYFNLDWLEENISDLDAYRTKDIQATLLHLSCQSIADELKKHHCETAYVCGGGAQNSALMEMLENKLNGVSLHTTEALGIAPDWVEAIGFAWLGYCKLNGIPSNLPSVTGARKAVVLGASFEPSSLRSE